MYLEKELFYRLTNAYRTVFDYLDQKEITGTDPQIDNFMGEVQGLCRDYIGIVDQLLQRDSSGPGKVRYWTSYVPSCHRSVARLLH